MDRIEVANGPYNFLHICNFFCTCKCFIMPIIVYNHIHTFCSFPKKCTFALAVNIKWYKICGGHFHEQGLLLLVVHSINSFSLCTS